MSSVKAEKRVRFLTKIEANHETLSQLKVSGRPVTRDTFKRNVINSHFGKIEKELGYDNKPGGILAKDNKMIEYWKCKFPEMDNTVFIYKPSQTELYVFV